MNVTDFGGRLLSSLSHSLSCRCHPSTDRQVKIEKIAHFPPSKLSPNWILRPRRPLHSLGFCLTSRSQQCPGKNVEVRRVQKVKDGQRGKGEESTEGPHSLPFHSFLNPPILRWRAHTPHGNLSFFNPRGSRHRL